MLCVTSDLYRHARYGYDRMCIGGAGTRACSSSARNWCAPRPRHGRSVESVRDDDPTRTPLRIVKAAHRATASEPSRPTITIADVAKACGLPQPVIAQLVPRTWTEDGWMYTEAQVQQAVEIAAGLTRPDGKSPPAHPDHPRPGKLR